MTDLEKIKHLLKHWLEHNEAHVSNYKEWASKAETLGEHELSHIIKQIADSSENLNELFVKAMDLIKKSSQ